MFNTYTRFHDNRMSFYFSAILLNEKSNTAITSFSEVIMLLFRSYIWNVKQFHLMLYQIWHALPNWVLEKNYVISHSTAFNLTFNKLIWSYVHINAWNAEQTEITQIIACTTSQFPLGILSAEPLILPKSPHKLIKHMATIFQIRSQTVYHSSNNCSSHV